MKKFISPDVNPTLDFSKKTDRENICSLAYALGNEKRLDILEAINVPPYTFSIAELSEKLGMPITTLAYNLNILENAALVKYEYHNSPKGEIRIYGRALQSATLLLYNKYVQTSKRIETDIQEVKIGGYANFYGGELGLVTRERLFYTINNNCFSPHRFDAELVYTPVGIIEYYFDNTIAKNHKVSSITFSLEICSEAPYYDANYKSDVTFWVNDKELTTHMLVGDFGDRPGKLNPSWWSEHRNTQYGQILTVSVNDKGVLVNGSPVNGNVTLSDLDLDKDNKISFKFGNKNTATHPGGFNLFGKGFGDYTQDIVLQTLYENR